jgi:NAD(P)-dependent dehydrogenase (short-subunit alcohol dehydrogenase family)
MRSIQQLAGKVAVVTGGASGIGRALAGRLVATGMRVIIADVEPAALAAAAAATGAAGILTDVTSPESVQALAEEVRRRYGGVQLFCSNAGVGSAARIADMAPADWSWLLGVNLWGAIHGIRSFLPLLTANAGGGDLIFTASEVGFRVSAGLGGYCVSKFAVVALAETLALELREARSGVTVTLLCPGPVRTRLGTSQRNRPPALAGGGLADSDLEATPAGQSLRWIEPEAAVDALLQGLERGDFYVFTHPEMATLVLERHARIAAALRDAATRIR